MRKNAVRWLVYPSCMRIAYALVQVKTSIMHQNSLCSCTSEDIGIVWSSANTPVCNMTHETPKSHVTGVDPVDLGLPKIYTTA